MIAKGGDAVDVFEQEVPESLHLGQPLPAQRLEPSHQEAEDAGPSLVRPEPIELLAQHIGLEQPPVRDEQRLELRALRSTDRLPPAQQQPPLATPVLTHDRAGAKKLLAADFIERGAGVLEHVTVGPNGRLNGGSTLFPWRLKEAGQRARGSRSSR